MFLEFEFMRNALAAGIVASIICGIIGTYVVVNKLVFLSGGIAHAAYGGIGLSLFFGLPYMLGTMGFTFVVSMIMASVTFRARYRADTIIGVIWAAGMAIGVIFTDLTPGYNVDLMSYLFGSILTVPGGDLWLMCALAAVLVVFVVYFYRDLLAISYDEEFALVRGVPVKALYFMLIAMISFSVVMVIRVVGLILVIALLTIAPYISQGRSSSIRGMMLISTVLNLVFVTTGLALSYAFDFTSGATIILVAVCVFFISMVFSGSGKKAEIKSGGHDV